MRIVTASELENWLTNGKVLEQDARGPKVVALGTGAGTQAGLFLKIFHTRRPPWLARLQPAARRFARNAARLNRLGIAVPKIAETCWLDPAKGLSACLYHPVPGVTLETLWRENPAALPALLPRLAAFIRQLHRQKIYFRSLHLGNIVCLPDGGFGLIDLL
ncbi:MAG: phosphotransferase, partial [Zoogloeaceae bacterium]|nr:phosphotransferase [Zoogloeaceae bacterium]